MFRDNAAYFMRLWHYWEMNPDLKEAKAFLKALGELEREEIIFLSEKYYQGEECATVATRKPISDKVMAERNGTETKRYTAKRQAIERKFMKHFKVYWKMFVEKEEAQAIQEAKEFVLCLGKFYLKDFSLLLGDYIDKEALVFTLYKDSAKVFTKRDEAIMNEFVRWYGLEKKLPVKNKEER